MCAEALNHPQCRNKSTHLVMGYGCVCAMHAATHDPHYVFELGFDFVLDRLLIACSMEIADERDAAEWFDPWNEEV